MCTINGMTFCVPPCSCQTIKTITKNPLCVTDNMDLHYECYSNGDDPYKD